MLALLHSLAMFVIDFFKSPRRLEAEKQGVGPTFATRAMRYLRSRRAQCLGAPQDEAGHGPALVSRLISTEIGLARHPQHGLDRRAADGVLRGAIDVSNVVQGDHAIDRHFALHEQVDQLRDELLGLALALYDPMHDAAELQKRHVERHL